MTTAVQLAQSVAPGVSLGFKNRLINGAMMIDQRNSGASVTVGTTAPYTLDRWQANASAASKYSVQQNAGSVTPPAGFTKYLGVTSLSAYSVGAGDYFNVAQKLEGFNTADFGWGTANAATVTLSFWVRSSLTGTFGGSFTNSGFNRSYPFTYTISAANTWEQKSITVAGDTTGTWNTDNSNSINVLFGLGVGSTYSGPAGSWAGTNYNSATGATSVVGTNGATFYITGVQLEKGSTATSFDYRPYGTELALCQRYCFVPDNLTNSYYIGGCNGTNSGLVTIPFPVQMRSAPSGTFTGTFGGDNFSVGQTFTAANTSLNSSTQNTGRVYFTSGTGTAFRQSDAFTLDTATTTGKIVLSAEL